VTIFIEKGKNIGYLVQLLTSFMLHS